MGFRGPKALLNLHRWRFTADRETIVACIGAEASLMRALTMATVRLLLHEPYHLHRFVAWEKPRFLVKKGRSVIRLGPSTSLQVG